MAVLIGKCSGGNAGGDSSGWDTNRGKDGGRFRENSESGGREIWELVLVVAVVGVAVMQVLLVLSKMFRIEGIMAWLGWVYQHQMYQGLGRT